MRLWFSVAVLLVLTCVVLEISAAKSKRGADASKDNAKSTDSKEVRYSKNKSEYKNKGKGKEQEQEVVRDKKRRSAEGSGKIDVDGVSKKSQKERGAKLPKEEQKRQKFIKQEKFGKNDESYKKEKTVVKGDKQTGKKQKRSLESEQSEETVINDAVNRKKEEFQSKKGGKSKSEMKSRKATVDSEKEGEVTTSDEEVAESEPSHNIVEEKQGSSKKVKKHKHAKNSEENVMPKKDKSKHEKIQTNDRETEESENGKSLNDLPEKKEKSYYLNEDGLIKEKQTGSKNFKKHKSWKNKSSETVATCEHGVNEKRKTVPEQKGEAQESRSCNVEADCLPDENIETVERSKYFSSQSNSEDIDMDEVENEAPASNIEVELPEAS